MSILSVCVHNGRDIKFGIAYIRSYSVERVLSIFEGTIS